MDIRELLRARLAQLDPALDTSDGSYADRTVLTPITDALGADPLALDPREFLTTKYAEAFPSMPLARGDAISDILISAAEVFLAGYRQQLSLLRNAQSISRVDLLSDEDADALAANWFVGRAAGAAAAGIVRVTVDRATPVALSRVTTVFRTLSGVRFSPDVDEVVSSERIAAGRVASNRYTFDVRVTATDTGSAGNIVAGEIYDVVGIGNVISVTNPSAFYGGVTGDTTEGLLSTKLPRAISERSLVTARGIIARIAASFSNASAVQVIGLDDPEMERDAVSADAMSDVHYTGVALVLGRTALLSCTALHPAAQLSVGMRVRMRAPEGDGYTLRVTELLDDAGVSLLRDADHSAWVRVDRAIGDGVYIVAAGTPSSAVLAGRQVGDAVHLGGRVDVYLRPNDEQPIELATTTASHIPAAIFGVGGRLVSGNSLSLTTNAELPRDTGMSVLEVSGTLYQVLYCESVKRRELRVYVLGDMPEMTRATPWALHRVVGAELTGGRKTIFPNSTETQLSVSGPLGSDFLTAAGSTRELAVAGVASGDIVELTSGTASFTVARVEGVRIYTRSPLHVTVPPTPATIQRAKESTPSPLGAMRSVVLAGEALEYKYPLGARTTSLSAEGAPRVSQRGFVAPSLCYAMRSALATGRLGHTLISHSVRGYSILYPNAVEDTLGAGVVRNYVTLPYSRTHHDPQPGASVVVAMARGAAELPLISAGPGSAVPGTEHQRLAKSAAHELELWGELFVPGTRNIFITLSDTDADEPYHAQNTVRPYDVLRVYDGPNRGSYLIAAVTHGTIVLDPFAATLSGNDNATLRADMQNGTSVTRRFSCIKIFGEFPVRELEHVERDIILNAHDTIVLKHAHGNDDVTVTPLVLEELAAALSGEYALGRRDTTLMGGLRALGDTCLYGTVDDDAATSPLIRTGASARQCNFAIIPAARGEARLVQEGSAAYARAATPSVVPLPVALRALTDFQITEYRTPAPSEITWGETSLLVTDSGLLYDTPRTDLVPRKVRRFAPTHMASHDLLTQADLVSPDCVTLDVDPDVLLSPCDLLVHEEVYLDYRATLSSSVTKLTYVPVQLVGTALTTDPQEISVDDRNGNPQTVRVVTAATLRAQFDATQLSSTNAAGVTLDTVLRSYALFALVGTDPVSDIFTFGPDYAIQSQGGGSIRFILQPERLYHSVQTTASSPVLSLATIGPGDRELRLVGQSLLSTAEPSVPVGSMLRITHRGEQLERTVVGTDGDVVYFDEPILTRDAAVRAYGMCVFDVDNGDVYLAAPSDYAVTSDGFGTTSPNMLNTYLHQGGASRPLSVTDAGRAQLTLWAVSESYLSLSANDEVVAGLGEDDVFAPMRQHLGSADVATVTNTTAVSPTTGAEYIISQRIRCSATPWLDAQIRDEMQNRNESYVLCCFVLTDTSVPLPTVAGDVHAVSTVQVFEQSPEVYHIAARSLDGDGSVALTTRRGDVEGPSYAQLSSVFRYELVDNLYVLASFDKNNPYNIRTSRTHGPFSVAATQLSQSPVGQTCPISHADGDGFWLDDTNRGYARSPSEQLHVLVDARSPERVGAQLSVNALFSALPGQVQALVSSRSERAVCADTRARRMPTAYVGLYASYDGGPSEEIMGARVRDVIVSALRGGAALSVADIMALMINMGATRVYAPIELYVCVEDMSRVRHRREIADTLTATQLRHIDATARIISVEAAPLDRALLGAQIVVRRGATTQTQLGNGGA